MTIIGLVRHGLTDWNVQMRAQGHTDIPLNAEGRRQAEMLGERMRGESWDAVYSSDLGRAVETASTAVRWHGLEVRVDKRLREVFLGEIEGLTMEERVAKWGEGWHERDYGAEPREAVAARGIEAINEYAGLYPGKRILVVSHGGLIGSTIRTLFPELERAPFIENTSVTLLRRSAEGGWTCELYNCVRHLSPA